MNNFNKLLSIILLSALAITTGLIIYLAFAPAPSDKFTEFYILNQAGKAADYPTEIKPGQAAVIILGVINHEFKNASYRIQLMEDGAIIKTVDLGIVRDKQRKEERLEIYPSTSDGKTKIEFYLFMDDIAQPHTKDPLVLNLDIVK
jgi:uncharacterized membrane protein